MKRISNYKQHSDLIWNIANLLRGPYRPPSYRRVMIPLTVLRRLDCVLEESKDKVVAMFKKLKAEKKYDTETIESIINKKFNLTFHNTSEFTFAKLLDDPDKLATNLSNFIAGFSSRVNMMLRRPGAFGGAIAGSIAISLDCETSSAQADRDHLGYAS